MAATDCNRSPAPRTSVSTPPPTCRSPKDSKPEGSGERGEAEPDQARHRDRRQRRVGRRVREAERQVVRSREPREDEPGPSGDRRSRGRTAQLAANEAQTQDGPDREERRDRPRPWTRPERKPRQAIGSVVPTREESARPPSASSVGTKGKSSTAAPTAAAAGQEEHRGCGQDRRARGSRPGPRSRAGSPDTTRCRPRT